VEGCVLKVVYISGPIRATTRGGRLANIGIAMGAASLLQRMGLAVICVHPLAIADAEEDCPNWLEGDMELVRRADAIFMLAGWEGSEGCRAELAVAYECGNQKFFEEAGGYERIKEWMASDSTNLA